MVDLDSNVREQVVADTEGGNRWPRSSWRWVYGRNRKVNDAIIP